MGSGIKRILTALVGIPLVAGAMFIGGLWFAVFVAIIAGIGQHELYRFQNRLSRSPAVIPGLLIGAVLIFRSHLDEYVPVEPVLLGVIVLLFLDAIRVGPEGKPLSRAGSTLVGIVYPALFLSYLPEIRDGLETSLGSADAFGLTLMLFVLIWICDTAAYYTGRALGKTPLAPSISPNKTWEGSFGGISGAIAGAAAARVLFFPFLTWTDVIVFGLIAGVIGQVGDLVESAMKRSADVKDSGTLLPGHGGILDRFDSIIMATPVYYLYLITCTTYL
jgi:phosphatidate cytidylyltransferase